MKIPSFKQIIDGERMKWKKLEMKDGQMYGRIACDVGRKWNEKVQLC